MGLDLATLNTDLGAYTRKYSNTIMAQVFQGIELEKYMTGVAKVTDEYVMGNATIGQVLQPFHSAWQPKGEVLITPMINKVRQMKVDFTLTDLDDLYRTYLAFMAEEGRERKDWPIVKYIVNEMLIPQMIEDMNTVSAKGVYSANGGVAGTAEATIGSVDGVLTKVTAAIAGGELTPIATGVITASNILDAVNAFVDGMPEKYNGKPMDILVSQTLATWYGRAYKTEYGTASNYTGNGESVDNIHTIDGSRMRIVGLNSFSGSQRMVATPKKNFLKLYDKVNYPSAFEIQANRRDIDIFTDLKRGYGFGTWEWVFVNDQA